MGVTDEVYIFGPPRFQYQQVGNGVCPPVALRVAQQIAIDCLTKRGVVTESLGNESNPRKRDLPTASLYIESAKRMRV